MQFLPECCRCTDLSRTNHPHGEPTTLPSLCFRFGLPSSAFDRISTVLRGENFIIFSSSRPNYSYFLSLAAQGSFSTWVWKVAWDLSSGFLAFSIFLSSTFLSNTLESVLLFSMFRHQDSPRWWPSSFLSWIFYCLPYLSEKLCTLGRTVWWPYCRTSFCRYQLSLEGYCGSCFRPQPMIVQFWFSWGSTCFW